MWEIVEVKITGDTKVIEDEIDTEEEAIEQYEKLMNNKDLGGKNLAIRESD